MKKNRSFLAALIFSIASVAMAQTAPLKFLAKYEMPASVQGRFDHLTADVEGNRIFVAAESAHEVLVFNLRTGKYLRAITGIEIPHAIFVRPDLNRIYITDGGPGGLRIYNGTSYQMLKMVPLKKDTDSIAYDPRSQDLYIVNGGGDAHETFSMVSSVNTATEKKVGEIKIEGDTLEAMAIPSSGHLMYVNNAADNKVSVINRQTHALITSWPVTMGKRNVAMALDQAHHRLFVACRSGELVVFDTRTGKELQSLPIGKGVDDLIFNPASRRIYASCGAGSGSTVVYEEQTPDHYKKLGEVATGPGGKNEALVSQMGRYYVVVPPKAGAPGAVYAYQVR